MISGFFKVEGMFGCRWFPTGRRPPVPRSAWEWCESSDACGSGRSCRMRVGKTQRVAERWFLFPQRVLKKRGIFWFSSCFAFLEGFLLVCFLTFSRVLKPIRGENREFEIGWVVGLVSLEKLWVWWVGEFVECSDERNRDDFWLMFCCLEQV